MGNKIEVDCLHAHLNIEQMDHKHGYIFAEQQFQKKKKNPNKKKISEPKKIPI